MRTVPSPSVPWVEGGTKLPFSVKVQAGSSGFAVVESPEPPFRQRLVRSKRTQRAALAAAAFILSGVALLFICKRLSNTSTVAGLPHRRLAGNYYQEGTSDEELDAILDQCLELEAEHGEPPSETDTAEPAAKKARLVAFLEEAASLYESAWQRATLSEEGLRGPSSRTYTRELDRPSVAHSSGLQSAGEALTHKTPPAGSGALEGVSLPGLETGPSLDSEALLQEQAEEGRKEGTEEGEEEGGKPVGTSVLHGTNDREQPSTSATLSGENHSTHTPGTDQGEAEGHPFFRLPEIHPGAIRRELRLVKGYSAGISGHSFFRMLEKMRELFLKPELDAEEVEELMSVAESMVWFLRNHRSAGLTPPFSPSHVVRHLGLNFLILDYLFCARQLLGLHMVPDQWWPTITEHVSTDFPMADPIMNASSRWLHNYALVKRLALAVSLLKSGIRPGAEEIVGLKKLLLCSPHADSRFKAPRWDPWREDDKEYARTREDPSVYLEDGGSQSEPSSG